MYIYIYIYIYIERERERVIFAGEEHLIIPYSIVFNTFWVLGLWSYHQAGTCAASPHTKHPQTKKPRVKVSGKFTIDLGIPPLIIKNMTESKP